MNKVVMEKKENGQNKVKVYKKRWCILTVVSLYGFLLGIDFSSFGQINNVLAKLFAIQPWQVDWLNLAAPVVYIVMTIHTSAVISSVKFRHLTIIYLAILAVGFIFVLLSVSITREFPCAVIGQVCIGFSVLFNFAGIPVTASIWFPSNEVALAVAVQMLARGLGEVVGSFVSPYLVHINRPVEQNQFHLMIFFGALASAAFLLTVFGFVFVENRPPSTPSFAQQNVTDQISTFTVKGILKECKVILTNKTVAPVLIAGCMCYVVIVSYTVLLSSILHKGFPSTRNINTLSGRLVMLAWALSTVSSLAAGPIIIKTRAYKGFLLINVFGMVLSCACVLLSFIFQNIFLLYIGMAALGLFDGFAVTCVLELLAEVIYPKPMTHITQLFLCGTAIMQLVYITVNRVILTNVGAIEANILTLVACMLAFILLLITKTSYARTEMNESNENASLLEN
ncbi:choline/ethanolamine transporter flvcr2a-like [Ciona intestinalis]